MCYNEEPFQTLRKHYRIMLSVIIFILQIISANASNQTIDQLIQANGRYWNFSNTLTDSSNNVAGTGYGGVGYAAGYKGYGLNCDGGDDYATLGNEQVYNISTRDFTMCLLSAMTTYGDKGTFNRWGAGTDDWDFRLSGAGAAPPVFLVDCTAGACDDTMFHATSNYVSGVWQTTCFVRRDGHVYAFMNGTKQDLGTSTEDIIHRTTTQTTVCKFANANYFAAGLVDEILFINDAGLNDTDIVIWHDNVFANFTYPFVKSSCSESLANTTLTEWQNMTGCAQSGIYRQNRSYTTYDINNCGFTNETYFEFQNVACEYVVGICTMPSSQFEYIQDLTEEINMLALIVLWLGLWAFGYWALQTRNDLLAGTMIVLTVPVDIYFAYIFQESLNIATGFLGIAFGVMSAWTFGVFVLLRRSVKG